MPEFKLKFESVAAIFLAALIFVSLLHSLQLNSLSREVAEQQAAFTGLKASLTAAYQGGQAPQAVANALAAAPAAQAPSGNSALPKNLQNLPNMVGGC